MEGVDVEATEFADGASAERSRPERSPSRLSPPTADAEEGGAGTFWEVGGAGLLESDPVLLPMELVLLRGSKSSSSSPNMSSESSSSASSSPPTGSAGWTGLPCTSTGAAGTSDTVDCNVEET